MKTKSLTLLALNLLILLSIGCSEGPKVPAPVTDSVMEKTDYIFKGVLQERHHSNLSILTGNEEANLVYVNEVLMASSSHENFEKGEITALLDADQSENIREDTEYLFYAKTWLFGESLAVVVNELRPTDQMNKSKSEINDFLQSKQETMLQGRIKGAQLVTSGKITDVNESIAEEVKRTTRLSEHNPNWKLAVISVDEIIKGSATEKTVQFYFASSMDVHWYQAPKFSVEKQGIFILQKSDQLQLPENALILIHPEDFRPPSEINIIKGLSK